MKQENEESVSNHFSIFVYVIEKYYKKCQGIILFNFLKTESALIALSDN